MKAAADPVLPHLASSDVNGIHEWSFVTEETTTYAATVPSNSPGSRWTGWVEHSGLSDLSARREDSRDRLCQNRLVAPLGAAAVVVAGGFVAAAAMVAARAGLVEYMDRIVGLMVVADAWIQKAVGCCKAMQVAKVCGGKTWLWGSPSPVRRRRLAADSKILRSNQTEKRQSESRAVKM